MGKITHNSIDEIKLIENNLKIMNKINAIESGDYLIIKSKKIIKRNLYIEAGNTYCTRIQYNGLICSLGLPTLEDAIKDVLKQASFLYPDIKFELNHCYDLCDVLTRFQFLKMDASFMKKNELEV